MKIRENSLNIVFGRKRCGKSTLMAKLSRQWLRKGYSVFSSYPLPGTFYFNPHDLGKFFIPPHSLVLIDECGSIFNNRDWKKFDSSVREWFKLQGHFKCTCFLFSQGLDIDKSIRLLCDDLYIQKKVFRYFSLLKHISRSIVITKASDFGGSDIVDEYRVDSFLKFWEHGLFFMPRYWKDFNSYETPYLPDYDDYVEYIEKK